MITLQSLTCSRFVMETVTSSCSEVESLGTQSQVSIVAILSETTANEKKIDVSRFMRKFNKCDWLGGSMPNAGIWTRNNVERRRVFLLVAVANYQHLREMKSPR